MGNLALQSVLQAVNYKASIRWGSLIGITSAIQFFVKECHPRSARVTAWFCNTQTLGLFCFVADKISILRYLKDEEDTIYRCKLSSMDTLENTGKHE